MAYSTRMTYTNTPFVSPTLILIITAYATLSESSIWKQCQRRSPYAIIHIKTYKYAHPIEINHISILLSLTVLFVSFHQFFYCAYFNQQGFQGYYTQDNDSSDSEEDFVTRTEPTFDTMAQAPRAPTVEEQILTLMSGMQELLRNNKESSSLIRPHLPEPDSFSGDRSAGAVESWVRTVECYLELSTFEEHL